MDIVNTTYDLTGVSAKNIPLIWGDIQPLVESALFYSEGEYAANDIYNLLMYQKMQLWVATDDINLQGLAVTEILEYPQMKVCSVVLAAGFDFDRWKHIADTIEKWAYSQGCKRMRNLGRPGWKRRAKEHGYDMPYVVYTKPLRVDDEDSH